MSKEIKGTSGIYCIRNKINNKIYIGQSKKIEERFSYHKNRLKSNKHQNKKLQNSWNKHGEHSFEFIIIKKCEVSKLNFYEQEYIKKHNSNQRNLGYNLDSGGSFNKTLSLETREKLSKAFKGRIFSKEHKEKLSKSRIGYIMKEETKEKLRKINTGKKHTEETKKKMSILKSKPRGKYPKWRVDKVANALRDRKGHPQTEETKRKISKANKGKKNFLGKKHKPETIIKMKKAWEERKKIKNLTQ